MKARLHLNIGLLYDKVNPDMSVKYLKKALDEAQQNRDGAIQHLALLQLCESHLLSGELSQALLFGQQVSILHILSFRRGPKCIFLFYWSLWLAPIPL